MKVITLAVAKAKLGINDTASDAKISAQIPYIDAKVKQIVNTRYNDTVVGDVVNGSTYLSVSSYATESSTSGSGINNPFNIDDLGEYLEIGQLIAGTGIPAETYIEDIIYDGISLVSGSVTYPIPVIVLSAAATEDAAGSKIYLGISIAYQDTIAKGIQHLINGTSTALPSEGLSSHSIGPVSKSYSAETQKKINKYGMPGWFIDGMPPRMASGH